MKSQHQHDIQKRQTENSQDKPIRPVCENSSSFCTFFHPDHPDAGRKHGNYTPIIPQPLSEPIPITTLSTTPQPPKVKGMPTSCSDLKLLGHQLNGLYLIKTSQQKHGTKIETIFCDFQSAGETICDILSNKQQVTINLYVLSPFSCSFTEIGRKRRRQDEDCTLLHAEKQNLCFYFQLHRSCKRNDGFSNGYLKKNQQKEL